MKRIWREESVYHVDGAEYNVDEDKLKKDFEAFAIRFAEWVASEWVYWKDGKYIQPKEVNDYSDWLLSAKTASELMEEFKKGENMTPKQALELKFECDDLGREVTIREYFIEILLALWNEKEGFSGKRPFGNSGWDYDIVKPLIQAGVIAGTIDENGYVESVNDEEVDSYIIEKLIPSL